jgi:endonuclease/exonuclease/phosphatase family metal-dependent hydrolase
MRLRFIHHLHSRFLMGTALCLMSAAGVHAAPLRVTTWGMQPRSAPQGSGAERQSEADRVQQTAAVLKKLDPDVIILQQVENWQSCDELIKALRPTNYNLAVCSSFRDAKTGALSRQQVAILSKTKSYISWSEAWKSEGNTAALPGGFAFAAIKVGNKDVGIFSVQSGDAAPDIAGQDSAIQRQGREASAQQLLRQIAGLKSWTANHIDAVVVAGDFNTSTDNPQFAGEKTFQLLEDAGLANAFGSEPSSQRITFQGNDGHAAATLDYIFTRNAGFVGMPQITSVDWSEHFPVTCDVDLNAPKVVTTVLPVARVDPPTVKPAQTPAAQTNITSVPPVVQQAVLPTSSKYKESAWWLAGAVSGGLLLIIVAWRLGRGSRVQRTAAITTLVAMKAEAGKSITFPAESGRIVVTHPASGTMGSAANTPTIIHVATPDSSQTQSQAWQRRAEEAERRERQAAAVARAGLIPHLSRWLKEKLVHKLVSDRSHLMETQQAAALKLLAVDDRLSRIESQLQQRNQDYEQRINELMRELAVAKEENRELIRAKITLVKAEMERERAKSIK